MNPPPIPAERNTSWPGSSILIWGTFGTKTPEGRRYHNRCTAALAFMVAGAILSNFLPSGPSRFFQAVIPGAAFTFIAWEFRRYLLALDELARRIQLEAIAWTYLTGLGLSMLLGGILFSYTLPVWFPGPWYYIFLEPVRAVWLYVISRRY